MRDLEHITLASKTSLWKCVEIIDHNTDNHIGPPLHLGPRMDVGNSNTLAMRLYDKVHTWPHFPTFSI
jgi:hypothetical protein